MQHVITHRKQATLKELAILHAHLCTLIYVTAEIKVSFLLGFRASAAHLKPVMTSDGVARVHNCSQQNSSKLVMWLSTKCSTPLPPACDVA